MGRVRLARIGVPNVTEIQILDKVLLNLIKNLSMISEWQYVFAHRTRAPFGTFSCPSPRTYPSACYAISLTWSSLCNH